MFFSAYHNLVLPPARKCQCFSSTTKSDFKKIILQIQDRLKKTPNIRNSWGITNLCTFIVFHRYQIIHGDIFDQILYSDSIPVTKLKKYPLCPSQPPGTLPFPPCGMLSLLYCCHNQLSGCIMDRSQGRTTGISQCSWMWCSTVKVLETYL